MIDDIENGRASPVVDSTLKHYHASWRELKRKSQPHDKTSPKQMKVDFSDGVSGNTSGVVTPIMVDAQPVASAVSEGCVVTPIMVGKHSSMWYGACVLLSTIEKPFVLLHLNMGKLTHDQLARLWHFRLGHPSSTCLIQ